MQNNCAHRSRSQNEFKQIQKEIQKEIQSFTAEQQIQNHIQMPLFKEM